MPPPHPAPPSDGDRGGPAPGEHAAPWVVDALLGFAVTLILAITVAAGAAAPPVAYGVAVAFGALVLLRRRFPRTVLVVTTLLMFAWYTVDLPPIGVAVPVAAALFSAADRGLLAWPIGTGAVVFAVSSYFRVQEGMPVGAVAGYESMANAGLIAASVALGHALHTRRARVAQQAEIARLTADRAAREAELVRRAERERLSRDLHDTVGHTMAVITLHAGVAADAVGDTNPAASAALARIREAGTDTLRDLRSLVRLLRTAEDGGEAARPAPTLAAIGDLAEAARAAGLRVDVEVDTGADPGGRGGTGAAGSGALPPAAEAAAVRVVQESLTNVVKHAGATHVAVEVRVVDGELHVTVADDGRGWEGATAAAAGGARPRGAARGGSASGGGAGTGGHGIAGMTERVRLLGGTLQVCSRGGLTVRARIPARPS